MIDIIDSWCFEDNWCYSCVRWWFWRVWIILVGTGLEYERYGLWKVEDENAENWIFGILDSGQSTVLPMQSIECTLNVFELAVVKRVVVQSISLSVQ